MADDSTSPLLIPKYIDPVVDFADRVSYELLKVLATYRSCHDGVPAEARIVLSCCQRRGDSRSLDEFVMKIKVQYTSALSLVFDSNTQHPAADKA